jgi:S1-C subfamily serine protease
VSFCINCGARNIGEAAFCSSCGQRIYRSSGLGTPRAPKTWKRLLVLACLSAVTALVVLLYFLGKTPHTDESAPTPSRPSAQLTVQINEKAVLTIVGTDRSGSTITQGSGFILTPGGLGGTNYHVLEGVSRAAAECCDGQVFEIGSIEGVDAERDLVVFQLRQSGSETDPQDLPHIPLGSTQNLTVGQKVIVIGSPQGLENTVSDGILSAIREYDNVRYLQITAPISPGSSGGPVLDASGQVIGVATLQFVKGQNLNFAVAVEHLRPLLDEHLQLTLAKFQSLFEQTNHKQAATPETAETSTENGDTTPKPLTGQFSGIVHNLSANASAEFVILVNDSDGALSGCMGVRQPLFGSGPLSGFVNGSSVLFTVKSAIGTITFVGQQEKDEINGSYTVVRQDSPNEEGTFTLRSVNSKGPGTNFDVANCPTDAEMNK